MLAYRLAKEFHIVDVKRWIASLPYGVLDQWIAFDSVEPIGEQWKQTAQLSMLVQRLIGVQMARSGVKTEDITTDDCMPPRFHREKKKVAMPKKQDVKSMFNGLKAAFGFKG